MRRRSIFAVVFVLALLSAIGAHATTTPAIFLIDLLQGPNTGGESSNGTILSIFGSNFGASRGSSTVTIGGGAVATYKTWCSACSTAGYDEIQVAIGSSAASGAVVVTVGGVGSTCNNHDDGCSFTVASGNLYYVSPSGSDGAAGSFAAPWATMKHAEATISPGDIVYVENGFSTGAPCDGLGWHANFTLYTNSGTSGHNEAYVVYPGATATIGALTAGSCSGDTTQFSIRSAGVSSYITLSGFTLRNAQACFEANQGTEWRLINMDCESVDPHSQFATFQTTGSSFVYAYGNNLHDVGGDAKLNSAMYFTSNTNHLWVGWNRVGDGLMTTSIQIEVHSTGGADQYDVHVHDNAVHNARCNGVVLASVDPSMGTVEDYNNVFWHNGTGPNPPDSSCFTYSNLDFSGTHDSGPLPSGNVQSYNDTHYDCAPYKDGGIGATYGCVAIYNQGSGTSIGYQFTNNIFAPTTAEGSYFNSDSLTSLVTGCAKNLYFQGGAAPSFCNTTAVTGDPLFVSSSTPNLNLQTGSPANAAGSVAHVPTYDFNGLLRPNPPSIGAYEYVSAGGGGVSSAPAGTFFAKGPAQ